jgi:hypothetical protein
MAGTAHDNHLDLPKFQHLVHFAHGVRAAPLLCVTTTPRGDVVTHDDEVGRPESDIRYISRWPRQLRAGAERMGTVC